MSRFGKCQNQAGCLLAYRGEETEIEDGQPFICSECGKPLTEVQAPSAMWIKYLVGLAIVGVVGIGTLLAIPKTRALIIPHKSHSPTPAPKVVEENPPDLPPGTTAVNVPAAEPPPEMVAPAKIDLDVSKQENKTVKAEVLKRVDLMPKVSNPNKDKLYGAVEKAKSMGIILTIPFGSNKSDLTTADLQKLRVELEKPEVEKLRGHPSLVFVLLGYADPKGDPAKNITVSQNRADTVSRAMKEKCDVINVIHTVGMGGSKLLDAQNLEKNRIVEIWAVLP